jgi:UDP-N-acetylglucosamine--N-acetylmuramyl-(pentapeptide) pyrophosphoryl-undecaprenol N-acetylglucosamine transferase
MTARIATRLCAAYALPKWRRRQTVTGRPSEARYIGVDRAEARATLGIPDGELLLIVTGGSGGALRLNDAVWQAWASDEDPQVDGRPLHIVQLAGARDLPRYGDAPASARYTLAEFRNDLPTLLAAADLVVARAGSSVFEMAAAGCATVLVPSPNVTADHQTLNARHFLRANAVLVEKDETFDAARLRAVAGELLSRDGDARRAQLGAAMAAMAKPNAAREIAQILEQVAHAQRVREVGTAAAAGPVYRHPEAGGGDD